MRARENRQARARVLRYSAYPCDKAFTEEEEEEIKRLMVLFYPEEKGRRIGPKPVNQLLQEIRSEMVSYNCEILERYVKEYKITIAELSRIVECKGVAVYLWFKKTLPTRKKAEIVLKKLGVKLYSMEDAKEKERAIKR